MARCIKYPVYDCNGCGDCFEEEITQEEPDDQNTDVLDLELEDLMEIEEHECKSDSI